MNKIAIAFLAAASLASFGCKKKGGGDSAAFEKHVDAVCACKEQACLDKENADYMKANTAAPADPEAAKKMADDPKMKELTQKLTECTTRVMTAGTPPAGGAAPAGGTPPAGGAAPAGGDGSAAAPAGGTPPAGGDGSAAAPAGGTPPAAGDGSGSAAK
jgi:hypothetical protein